jgi:FtsZ-interacting cell division protein ZipA
MSSTVLIVVIVVVVIALLALVAFWWSRIGRRRSERLRRRFGPEYERRLAETGDPAETDRILAERVKRHRGLQLRDLDDREREIFEHRWTEVQREFVDDPDRAVDHADTLVDELMSARGYPVGEPSRRADDVSVDHPEAVHRYRAARDLAAANRRRQADTEDLREAVTAYRDLVHALLGRGAGEPAEQPPTHDTRPGRTHA